VLVDVGSSTLDAEDKAGCESDDVREGELIEATLSYYQQSCAAAVYYYHTTT